MTIKCNFIGFKGHQHLSIMLTVIISDLKEKIYINLWVILKMIITKLNSITPAEVLVTIFQ